MNAFVHHCMYKFIQLIVVGVNGHHGVHAAGHVMLASGGGIAQALILRQHSGAFFVSVIVLSWTHVASTLAVVGLLKICN